jgi:DNA-binding transcriptional LysR family regulator
VKLAHLEVCNAVLITGTVSGAARLLHTSQPAVTKMLQSAENQFGFKLFTREKNRLVPTQEAIDLHPEIVQLAAQVDRLRAFARALGTEKSSFLRIDCPPSIASTFLPICIEQFSARFPNVSCQVETHTQPDIVDRLMRRQCDLGFSLAWIPNPAIIDEVIVRGRGVCVVPHGMLARAKSTVSWKDLSACRLIRVPPGGLFGGLTKEDSFYTDEVKPGSLAVSTNYLAMRMAERGLGIASIDSFTAASVDTAKARILALSPSTDIELRSMHRVQAKLSNAATRFIQIVAQVAREAHDSLGLGS